MGRVLNSGPAPDPNALRRNRRDDQGSWTRLPDHGLLGDLPDWPEVIAEPPTVHELAFWNELWRDKPQAHVWLALGMEMAVATYVRTALYAASVGAKATYLTAVRQQAEGLLLTPAALRSSRYLVKVDPSAEEVQDPDAAPAPVVSLVRDPEPPRGSSVLGRLGGLSTPGPQPVDDDVDDVDDDEQDGED